MKNKFLIILTLIIAVMAVAHPSFSARLKEKVYVHVTDKKSGKQTLITAWGLGLAPRKATQPKQAYLLAKRAATVNAYRNLLRAFGDIATYICDGSSYIKERGFIKGVEILDERKYPDGRVEVEVGIKVNLRRARSISRIEKNGYRVIYETEDMKKPSTVITRQQWLEMHSEE